MNELSDCCGAEIIKAQTADGFSSYCKGCGGRCSESKCTDTVKDVQVSEKNVQVWGKCLGCQTEIQGALYCVDCQEDIDTSPVQKMKDPVLSKKYEAYDKEAKKYFREFAYLNFPMKNG